MSYDEKETQLLFSAWTIIANAWEGNWEQAPQGWQRSATRWRDQFHQYLNDYPAPVGVTGAE